MSDFISNIRLLNRISKYLTWQKIVNFLSLYFHFTFSAKTVKFNSKLMPFFVSVEPADFCQLECPECPVGISAKHSGTYITSEKFTKIIEELKNKLIYMNLYFQGEPLLNKNLPQLIQIAASANIFTTISTNAQALNSEKARQLVESGLERIIISVDGTNQTVYEQYRKGGKLEKVITGIGFMNFWKKELASKTPFIEIQFIVFKTNEHQLPDIKQLAKKLKVDKLSLKSAQIYDFKTGKELLTNFNRYARYKINDKEELELKNKVRNRCWRQWSGSVMNVKGDVIPCCFDKHSEFVFGNIADEKFANIWHNTKISGFRASILQNRKQYDMCKNCTSK